MNRNSALQLSEKLILCIKPALEVGQRFGGTDFAEIEKQIRNTILFAVKKARTEEAEWWITHYGANDDHHYEEGRIRDAQERLEEIKAVWEGN